MIPALMSLGEKRKLIKFISVRFSPSDIKAGRIHAERHVVEVASEMNE